MKPPSEIPRELFEHFTLNRKVEVKYRYIDNTSFVTDHKFFKKKDIDRYINQIEEGKTFYYGKTDNYLRNAFDKYPVKGLNVAVIGSQKPLYESFIICYGGKPFTIDYHKIETDDERLHLMTVEEFEKDPVKFDAIISISSIEHDGLGRYGDPVDPEGDLKAMGNISNMLEENGIFYFAVPRGKDQLVWNAHRIYGKIRLKMLLKKWTVEDVFGYPWLVKLLKRERQPVYVLRKKITK